MVDRTLDTMVLIRKKATLTSLWKALPIPWVVGLMLHPCQVLSLLQVVFPLWDQTFLATPNAHPPKTDFVGATLCNEGPFLHHAGQMAMIL